MEFLFTNQLASWEALLLLISLAIIVIIYTYDAYLFIARVIGLITPRQEYLKEKTPSITPDEPKPLDIDNPILTEVGDTANPLPETHLNTLEEASDKDISLVTPETEDKNETETIKYISESTQEVIEEINLQEEALENAATSPSTQEIQNMDMLPSSIPEIQVEESQSPELSADEIRDAQELPIENQIPSSILEKNNLTEKHTEVLESLEMNDTTPDDPMGEWKQEAEAIGVSESISERENDTGTVDISDEARTDEEYTPETIKEDTPEIVPETENVVSSTANEMTEEWIQEGIPEEKMEATESPRDISQDIPKTQPMIGHHDEKIAPEKREKIVDIVSMAKTLIARGHLIEARTFIIEGLSLHKKHRDLNILLANLYEREYAFEKAEFIYKDIAEIYPHDSEVLIKLADVLAMQRKYRVSYEIYKKTLGLNGENEETLYALIHLAAELKEDEELYGYARTYIKQFPKNPEILWLYSQAQITLGKRREAIETLIKLKNLTPYNQEIIDLIQKLVTEEELAGNFGNA